MAENTGLEVKLEVFEGPLDLLLHLIKTLEIDIYDIPIAMITEQYMRYLKTMQEQKLDVAGSYFVMAATLMAIKSKMLLPVEEVHLEDDNYEDPRQELVDQLLEYQKYKEVALVLEDWQEKKMDLYVREALDLSPFEDEASQLRQGEVALDDLTAAFQSLLQKQQEQKPAVAHVTVELFTVDEQMKQLLNSVSTTPLSFQSVLKTGLRQELVYTFLALLELMKTGEVVVVQATQYGEIMITKGDKQDA